MVSTMEDLYQLDEKKRKEEFFSELLDKIGDIHENSDDLVGDSENKSTKDLSSSKSTMFRRVLRHTILNAKKKI